jgi:two-component system, cell cycle sensor histidine kinase and response regulator CckA
LRNAKLLHKKILVLVSEAFTDSGRNASQQHFVRFNSSILGHPRHRSLFRLIVPVIAGLVVCGTVSADIPPAANSERFLHPIVVPTVTDSYPMSFRGPTGEYEGFSVELLDAIARVMDLKLQRVSSSAVDLQPGLLAGEYDLLQNFSRVPEREKYLDFSVPYIELQGTLFVRKENNSVQKISDLNDREVVIIGKGSIGDELVRNENLKARVVYESSVQQALQELDSGQHDTVFSSRLTALSVLEHFKLDNVRPLGVPVDGYSIPLCFAVRKGDSQLLARLNEGLAILHRTGEFDRIYNKWFGRFEPTKFTSEELIACVAAALAAALFIALWGLMRQRQLRSQIAEQAAEIAESRAILAEAQHFARIGHWQLSLSAGKPAAWSDETYHILGRDPRRGPLSFAALTHSIFREDRGRWLAVMRRSVNAAADYALDVRIESLPGLRKTIHVRGRPVHDARGQLTGYFGTAQDVTEWREAERAQRETAQLLHALYDNAPYAMGVFELIDRKITVVSVNPEAHRILGLKGEPVSGGSLSELGLAPEQVSFWTELFARYPDNGAPFKTTLRHSTAQRELAVTLVPLGVVNKHPRFCLIAEDITERVHKDAEIAQSRRLRAIGELVGGIAHEFNNLLTPILLKADALQQEWSRQPAFADELQVIIDAAMRASEITRRLLTFGRKMDRRPEKIRLRTAIESDLELLRHTVDRRIQLQCIVPPSLPLLWLPSTDLHQIVVNLLLNARDTLIDKLSRQPGNEKWIPLIQIEAEAKPVDAAVPIDLRAYPRPAGWIRLTLRDNGLGMPPDVIERIFEPFYTTKPTGQGTGLGLATVWHLITELGGRIDVDSTPNVGTAFHLWLPVRNSTDTTSDSVAASPPSAVSLSSGRVLLVEDEEVVSRLVCEILERQGHRVTVFAEGRGAWEKLSATPGAFDAIVMDFNMPGLNGLELARRARDLPFNGIILVISGRVTEADRAEFLRCGVNRIIEKPFTLETFVAVLAAFGLARPRPVETVPGETAAH